MVANAWLLARVTANGRKYNVVPLKKSERENAHEAAQHPRKNVVTSIFQTKDQEPAQTTQIEVLPRYRVILMSDGIADSLLPVKIAALVKDKTPLQAMQTISDVTTNRFKASEALHSKNPGKYENYSDGFYQEPKPDN